MKTSLTVAVMLAAAAFFILPNAGCPQLLPSGGDTTDDGGTTDGGTTDGGTTDGGTTDGGTTDGSGTAAFTIVKTGISMRHDAALRCGTDLIAFGTGYGDSSIIGVSYIIPSTAPTAGTPVTNTELYACKGFAVGGHTIFLAGSNTASLAFQVSVFDALTGTMLKTFDAEEIRLGGIPVGADDPGHMQADGNYCVVICDENEVTDGKIIKVIDVSGAEPALIAFDQNPVDYNNMVDQVAVDAATGTVVVAADDTFFVYDIAAPDVAPTQIAAPNGIGDVQMQMNGSYVIALDDQSYPQAMLVDLAGASIIQLPDGEGTFDLDIGSQTFAFYADYDSDDSSGGSQRAAVGTVPGPGFSKAAMDDYIDGSTTNNGLVGYAGSLCVVPDDSYVFLGGWYLQYSTGGASFVVPADPEGADTYGTPAWDVDCSAKLVGFKTATTRSDNTETTVGYIILP
ncbi:MAG: hypothetical protein JXO22_16870 [Phycisphaerae bacterium]|nr:hypothetical protein [Phycisphaerae bacterium]